MESIAASRERARRALPVLFLGRVPYRQAEELQNELRDRLLRGEGSEVLLLLEHPPVITLGRNAADGGVVASAEWLERLGVELVHTDRGGQATFHGPGQLVGYPVLDLAPDRRDVRRYVRDLQRVLVTTLGELGVEAELSDDERPIGVWVGRRKIASIGIHLKRWITTHGFALNLSTDLSFFDLIRPCGLDSMIMTSVERLTGSSPSVVEAAERCARHFLERFERRPTPWRQDALPGESSTGAVDLAPRLEAAGEPG